jgi:four helix bundle protein
MPLQHYKDLIVWQKSMDLVLEVYRLTRKYPKVELFSLTNQTQRAVVSIPSNIAEGYGRSTTQDYLRFCYIARGSLNELETHLLIASRLGYLAEVEIPVIQALIEEVSKILNGLIRSLCQKAT